MTNILQKLDPGSYSFSSLNFAWLRKLTRRQLWYTNLFWSTVVKPAWSGAPELSRDVLAGCCAQFIVSKERIQTHPLSFYRHLLRYTQYQDTSDAGPFDLRHHRLVPYAFEFTWHAIFGEQFVTSRPGWLAYIPRLHHVISRFFFNFFPYQNPFVTSLPLLS
jgi:hypothetical protein